MGVQLVIRSILEFLPHKNYKVGTPQHRCTPTNLLNPQHLIKDGSLQYMRNFSSDSKITVSQSSQTSISEINKNDTFSELIDCICTAIPDQKLYIFNCSI